MCERVSLCVCVRERERGREREREHATALKQRKLDCGMEVWLKSPVCGRVPDAHLLDTSPALLTWAYIYIYEAELVRVRALRGLITCSEITSCFFCSSAKQAPEKFGVSRRFECDMCAGRNVSCMAWNTLQPDLLAVHPKPSEMAHIRQSRPNCIRQSGLDCLIYAILALVLTLYM